MEEQKNQEPWEQSDISNRYEFDFAKDCPLPVNRKLTHNYQWNEVINEQIFPKTPVKK